MPPVRPLAAAAAARPPMPVEFATAKRAPMAEQILVVGNLIGAATVEVVPRANGGCRSSTSSSATRSGRAKSSPASKTARSASRCGRRKRRIRVAQASIRQREADLKLAQNNLDRSRNLYERQLLPQQTFDDVDARYQAAAGAARPGAAQFEQAKARLDELKITLSNTQIVSPVDGFIGKRYLDPGAFASTNAPVASVVDIRTVRMVANLVERDMRRVPVGTAANVEVDAYPGEKFKGRVSRVAPVFDPATRTAEIEIEVPNVGYRLKPGMYSRVQLTIDTQQRRDHRAAQRAGRSRRPDRRVHRRSAGESRRRERHALAARTARRPERDDREVPPGRSRHSRRRSDRDQPAARKWRARHHHGRQRAQGRRPDRAGQRRPRT